MARLTVHLCHVCGKGIAQPALVKDTVGGHTRPFHRSCHREWVKPAPEPTAVAITPTEARPTEPPAVYPERKGPKSQHTRGPGTRVPKSTELAERVSFPRKTAQGEILKPKKEKV